MKPRAAPVVMDIQGLGRMLNDRVRMQESRTKKQERYNGEA